MTFLSTTHIIFLTATIGFLVLSAYVVSKLAPRTQNLLFLLAALGCAAGIFSLYGVNGSDFTPGVLGMNMLQVPAFNLILVLFMMIPRFELARQYGVMFSMFATFAYLVFIPEKWASLSWSDPTVWVFWLSNLCAIALPVWMVAARCLKPRREYISWVLGCVFLFFSVSYMATIALNTMGILAPENSFALFSQPANCPLLALLYAKIPHAYFYLWPLIPALYIFFRLYCLPFRKYGVDPYRL